MALMLSHHMRGQDRGICKSLNKDRIQDKVAAVYASCLYSASILEQETPFCFLELQEMRLGPINMQEPPVDTRSSRSPT